MIYMSNLVIGEMEGNPQFKSELNKAIGHHKGELTIFETGEGKIVIKSVPDKKSIYVCFDIELKNPTGEVGRKKGI